MFNYLTTWLIRWVWLNWLECQVVTLEVEGSNPFIHPIYHSKVLSHNLKLWDIVPNNFRDDQLRSNTNRARCETYKLHVIQLLSKI